MARKKMVRDDLGGMDNMFHERGEMAPTRRAPVAAVAVAPKARPAVAVAPNARPTVTAGSSGGTGKAVTLTPERGKVAGKRMNPAPTKERGKVPGKRMNPNAVVTMPDTRKPVAANPFQFIRSMNSGTIDRPKLPKPLPTGNPARRISEAAIQRLLNRDRKRYPGPQ